MSIQQDDPILEAYVTETSQLVEQLEDIILICESSNSFSNEMINEIFRIMHTIKGSSSMMHYNNIATLAHVLEDLFSFLRSSKIQLLDWTQLSDLMLDGVDFTKIELEKIKNGDPVDGDASAIIEAVNFLLTTLENEWINDEGMLNETQDIQLANEFNNLTENVSSSAADCNVYRATIFFTEECDMENVRAFQIVHSLKDIADEVQYVPENLVENSDAIELIKTQGFQILLKTNLTYEAIHYHLHTQTSFLKEFELQLVDEDESQQLDKQDKLELFKATGDKPAKEQAESKKIKNAAGTYQGSSINVNVNKLDELMDLVGELVIAEAMVTQNSDVLGLELEQFHKAANHLHKITKEIQDKVMEIRMVPLATTFQKMHRVVRDMSKKLGKNIQLQLIGEETEVDKNIIEHISDPLMHLVRNAIDHGIEDPAERAANNKPKVGTLTIEAHHVGGEVLIIVRDDGRGLNKDRILQQAITKQIIYDEAAAAALSDKDIYNLIFVPGFSTKEKITEFSGRGVGMDVVAQNITAVGGTVTVDSVYGKGSAITFKIPLTLAIIDGMTASVGEMKYTIPTNAIKESFKPSDKDILTDPNGNELIMVRGQCYPIVRLHTLFNIDTEVEQIHEGILIMVEHDTHRVCIFVEQLLGQQQIVVKALPTYIRKFNKIEGISGCTLLGDGDISLILDIQGLLKRI